MISLRVLCLSAVTVALATSSAGCRKKTVDNAPKGAPLSEYDCQTIRSHAGAALGSAVTSVNPPGGNVCSSDAECVELEPASCLKVCWGNAVPKSSSTKFTDA